MNILHWLKIATLPKSFDCCCFGAAETRQQPDHVTSTAQAWINSNRSMAELGQKQALEMVNELIYAFLIIIIIIIISFLSFSMQDRGGV